uniref:Uncharacterized protein n=1 Tax=Nelumbo nucifera TaxID=4432 RepID=A0A822YZM0_NELNU|nr:TPA_asm: hypothetical protein HUJ06_008334 [Nelumbo nucifera]
MTLSGARGGVRNGGDLNFKFKGDMSITIESKSYPDAGHVKSLPAEYASGVPTAQWKKGYNRGGFEGRSDTHTTLGFGGQMYLGKRESKGWD